MSLSRQIKKLKVGESLKVADYNIVAILNNKYIFGASVGLSEAEKAQKYDAPQLFVELRRLNLI